MKFDFEKGKERLLEWMDMEFDCSYGYSLQYIKELSTIGEIQNEVESFRRFEESWINKTIAVKKADTMREIFIALKDTAIEDDDNFIIELFTTEQ
jgi:DNA-binding PadR family transcriptional regulator